MEHSLALLFLDLGGRHRKERHNVGDRIESWKTDKDNVLCTQQWSQMLSTTDL